MPSTEAQLRAAKKYRETHRDKFLERIYEWREENVDKQREYARRSMAKNYAWKCAIRDLHRCLLEN
jgi:phosphopantetheinyl transferase (holo-ACP synthase)